MAGWTKRQIIMQAFASLGLNSYDQDIEPSLTQDALYRLDTLAAEWSLVGINIAYKLPAVPTDSKLDDAAGVPDTAVRALYSNLAVDLAPTLQIIAPPHLVASAKLSYNKLYTYSVGKPLPQQLNPYSVPAGAGAQRRTATFLPKPTDVLTDDDQDVIEL